MLVVRHVDLGQRRDRRIVLAHVADDADDGHETGVSRPHMILRPIGSTPGNAWRASASLTIATIGASIAVAVGEIAAAAQRDRHRAEIVGRDDGEHRLRRPDADDLGTGPAFEPVAAVGMRGRGRQPADTGDRITPGSAARRGSSVA